MRVAVLSGALILLCGCTRYSDFTLPPLANPAPVSWTWQADPSPELTPGASWDSVDVLNPSVLLRGAVYWNLYSGFDGRLWHTGLATSPNGRIWTKQGKIISPAAEQYIAANGAAIEHGGEVLYFYQLGLTPEIALVSSKDGRHWRREAVAVVPRGPYGSWDERGVGDPYVIEQGNRLYLFYTGIDRARRQRLGVAMSSNGRNWQKLRSNPILEPGGFGVFDENGVGEPAVWAYRGRYWMLYAGRDRRENRKLGLAESVDGVHWRRTPLVIAGDQAWDAKVICDPTVIAEPKRVRVWFGGGNVARPDENIHGQIGYGELTPGP